MPTPAEKRKERKKKRTTVSGLQGRPFRNKNHDDVTARQLFDGWVCGAGINRKDPLASLPLGAKKSTIRYQALLRLSFARPMEGLFSHGSQTRFDAGGSILRSSPSFFAAAHSSDSAASDATNTL